MQLIGRVCDHFACGSARESDGYWQPGAYARKMDVTAQHVVITNVNEWRCIGNDMPHYGRELVLKPITPLDVDEIVASLTSDPWHPLWPSILAVFKLEVTDQTLHATVLALREELGLLLTTQPFSWWVDAYCTSGVGELLLGNGVPTNATSTVGACQYVGVQPRIDYTLTELSRNGPAMQLQVRVRRVIEADGTVFYYEGGYVDLAAQQPGAIAVELQQLLLHSSWNDVSYNHRLVRVVLPSGEVLQPRWWKSSGGISFADHVETRRQNCPLCLLATDYVTYTNAAVTTYMSPIFEYSDQKKHTHAADLDALTHQYDVVVQEIFPQAGAVSVRYLNATNEGTGSTFTIPIECLTPSLYNVALLGEPDLQALGRTDGGTSSNEAYALEQFRASGTEDLVECARRLMHQLAEFQRLHEERPRGLVVLGANLVFADAYANDDRLTLRKDLGGVLIDRESIDDIPDPADELFIDNRPLVPEHVMASEAYVSGYFDASLPPLALRRLGEHSALRTQEDGDESEEKSGGSGSTSASFVQLAFDMTAVGVGEVGLLNRATVLVVALDTIEDNVYSYVRFASTMSSETLREAKTAVLASSQSVEFDGLDAIPDEFDAQTRSLLARRCTELAHDMSTGVESLGVSTTDYSAAVYATLTDNVQDHAGAPEPSVLYEHVEASYMDALRLQRRTRLEMETGGAVTSFDAIGTEDEAESVENGSTSEEDELQSDDEDEDAHRSSDNDSYSEDGVVGTDSEMEMVNDRHGPFAVSQRVEVRSPGQTWYRATVVGRSRHDGQRTVRCQLDDDGHTYEVAASASDDESVGIRAVSDEADTDSDFSLSSSDASSPSSNSDSSSDSSESPVYPRHTRSRGQLVLEAHSSTGSEEDEEESSAEESN